MPIGRRRNRIDRTLRERGVPPDPQIRERVEVGTAGPWDAADAPDDGMPRIDLGSLRLPAVPGMELRVEVNQQQQVVAATLRAGESLLQVSVFAAPRAGGLWDEVRAELARSASGQGGRLAESEGPFGPELSGTVVATTAGQPGQPAPKPERRAARFLGVDGPRWFLRGLLNGPAAAPDGDPSALEEAFRQIVVVRGSEPMPVRDPLPLKLPAQAAEQLARQQQAGRAAAPRAARPAAPPVTPPAARPVSPPPASPVTPPVTPPATPPPASPVTPPTPPAGAAG
ncbi:DUF3710 domain-containing protein [Modestobacter roseus]|uniref:Uncharacterized protein DUF3710 n=1 Tax=Modestobacter roseus TaxID=1181884 RepID=A0A562IRK6_9ACTN|nr:DUF3710 domain-containing protein [Modestobacter roseus]MQA31989.1 DUF3710 domain-containing protein [Modestobacter roseus]TWH73480.1 uncharacterized protein DUF3710 [Modestobacter roseus]